MTSTLIIIFAAYILTVVFSYCMKFINMSYLKKHGDKIPRGFEEHIDAGLLKKTSEYTVEYSRFGYIASIIDNLLLMIFLFGGVLSFYNSWIDSLGLSFVLQGILFFLLLSFASTILELPFDIYGTFKIENKYGFNTTTPKIWITDQIKSFLISTILLVILGGVGFWLVQASPELWWVWLWIFFLVFSLFLMYISPYVIEPLFNKFTPISEDYQDLEEDIKSMFSKIGIKVSNVFQVDASKRSKHTNAYFTGIGKVKRIILYDTLL